MGFKRNWFIQLLTKKLHLKNSAKHYNIKKKSVISRFEPSSDFDWSLYYLLTGSRIFEIYPVGKK